MSNFLSAGDYEHAEAREKERESKARTNGMNGARLKIATMCHSCR